MCLSRADGRELWRRESPRPRQGPFDRRNGPASPSAAADAARVVVFFADFGLVAYDHAGRELWRTPLGPFDNVYGMGASPILAEGLVVLVCDQVAGSFLAAFDAASGRECWRRSATGSVQRALDPGRAGAQRRAAELVLPPARSASMPTTCAPARAPGTRMACPRR